MVYGSVVWHKQYTLWVKCRYLLAATSFSVFLYPANANESTELSAFECNVIQTYSQHYADHDFSFLVGHMAHNSELCESEINCEIALSKRKEPFFLVPERKVPSELLALIGTNLAYTSEFLEAFAGLYLGVKPNLDSSDSRIRMILVEPDEVGNSYSSVHPKLLVHFIATDAWPCMAVNSVWQDNSIEYSEIWIKTDIGEAAIASCVKEEIYNASGVQGDPPGLASLFSQTEFSGEKLDPPLYERFSVRDRIVLQLVYDYRMENGQSRAETEALAGQIIDAQCD